jgi:Carboxypeptidase regulatory-like domain/Domain of unknown function (DUF4214)
MKRFFLVFIAGCLFTGNVWGDNSKFYGTYSVSSTECEHGTATSSMTIGNDISRRDTEWNYHYIPLNGSVSAYSGTYDNEDYLDRTYTISGDTIRFHEFQNDLNPFTELCETDIILSFFNDYSNFSINGSYSKDGDPVYHQEDCSGPMTGNGTRTSKVEPNPPTPTLSAPTLSSPVNGSVDISLTTTLLTNAFSGTGNTHLKTDWQISTSKDFSSATLFEESTVHLTTLIIPDLMLKENTTYYWRARFYDSNSTVSDWSSVFSFTTLQTQNDTNLNGIPDTLENTTVDLDADGTADIQQTNLIKTLNTVVGSGQMGASIKESATITTITEVNSIDPSTISDFARPESMPLGLFSLRATVANPGDTGNVTIYFSEAAPSGAIWYFYDSINGWTDYSQYATFSSDRKSVSVQLKDGGYGDADGIANGIIVDPSGFGIASWIKGAITDSSTGQKIKTATISFSGLNLNLNTLLDGNYISMILPGNYSFSVSAPGYTAQAFSNVEIQEAGIVTKDISLSSSGGSSTGGTNLTQTQVSQLYVSIFGRTSEGEGNSYWQSNQTDMTIAANTMLDTDPAKTYFGSTLNDNQAFIEFIYLNTLGKTYAEDSAGVDYWVNQLAAGKSKGEVIATMISAAIDPQYAGSAAQDQFNNKVIVCSYSAGKITTVPDVNNLAAFVNFIKDVTHDSSTVTAAKAAVDTF